MVLKCFASGVQHGDQRITMGGKLSAEKVGATDPAFLDAINNGILNCLYNGFDFRWYDF